MLFEQVLIFVITRHVSISIELKASGEGATTGTPSREVSATWSYLNYAAGVHTDGFVSAALVFCGFSLFAVRAC